MVAMTIESVINKVLNARDVQSLREATAEGLRALTQEPDMLARIAALESQVSKMEVVA